MTVNIVLGVLAGNAKVFDEMILACPRPVIGPKVYVTVVYVAVGTDTLIAPKVVLTAP
jgi:hypothetical protein